jgi:hypothetical protein
MAEEIEILEQMTHRARTVELNAEEIVRLRECVIGQSGYGHRGCALCGKRWVSSDIYYELKEHTNCIASPIPSYESSQREEIEDRIGDRSEILDIR